MTHLTIRHALGIALLAALIQGCKKSDSNAFVPPPPPEVIVANPVEREVTQYLTYTGTVEASERVELRARVQGFLEKVNFQPGQRVKKDQVLFEIDPRQYQAAVSQAKAAVEAQKAALVGAENDARLARELADQRAGPEIDAVIKAARRDAVIAEIARAEAELEAAQLNLDYCTIRSPIDGRISRNLVDIGNLVGRDGPTLLAEIVRVAPCFVSVDVSESDVLNIRRNRERAGQTNVEPGQVAPGEWRPCELALAGQDEFKFSGRIDYVAPALDTTTGTLRVRARFENTDESLIPGLFARARFPMSTVKATLVPDAALLSDQQGRFALVVDDADEVQVRRVDIGGLEGQMRVVNSGLTTADRVVTLGVLKARPGSKVSPKTADASAPAATSPNASSNASPAAEPKPDTQAPATSAPASTPSSVEPKAAPGN